ncbi:MAG: polysaccharide biosynthesis tyrosine autokinase [Candidatus Omnitrophota bacterium]
MPQYELNLRDYVRIFHKRKLVILFTFFAVFIGSLFYLSKKQPVYQASATIKIEERKTIAGLLTEMVMYSPGDVMESETKFIKGYPVMKKVALLRGLIDEKSPVELVNSVVSNLQGSIDSEKVGNTNMIRIVATADNAKEAMDLANSVADVYIEENLVDKAKQARHTRQFIEEQLASLEDRLRQAEDKLRIFGDEVKNIKLAEPMQQKLLELEFQLADLMQKYTEKHPRVIQAREQIEQIESQVKGFSGQELEYTRLTREIDVNKKLYAMLKEKLEEARITEAQKVGDISVVNPAVLPSAPVSGNEKMGVVVGAFMGLILGVALAFVLETLDTSIGTIEDVENVVKLPVLGVIPSVINESDQGYGIIDRIRAKFSPAQKTEEQERLIRLFSHYNPKSPTTEAYRNIHTNLKLNPSKKSILVTSSGPREGKSSIAVNLSIVMAQAGLKTLLVSADLRRPVIAKTFGIKKEPGLNELLTGTVTLEDALKNVTDLMMGEMNFEEIRMTPGLENIWLLTSGRLPFNPPELIESKELATVIDKLKVRFDVIIFDAPPILPVTDASLLAPKIDCVVIVYEIGRTSREALIRAKGQLESVGAKIAGVVLNHTKSQTEAIATYPYYSHKYRYYGKEEPPKPYKSAKKEAEG